MLDSALAITRPSITAARRSRALSRRAAARRTNRVDLDLAVHSWIQQTMITPAEMMKTPFDDARADFAASDEVERTPIASPARCCAARARASASPRGRSYPVAQVSSLDAAPRALITSRALPNVRRLTQLSRLCTRR